MVYRVMMSQGMMRNFEQTSASELLRRALKSMCHGDGEQDPCQPYIYSISTVPEELCKWNEDAYMPKKITIGPLHMGTIGGPEQRLSQAMADLLRGNGGPWPPQIFFKKIIYIYIEREVLFDK